MVMSAADFTSALSEGQNLALDNILGADNAEFSTIDEILGAFVIEGRNNSANRVFSRLIEHIADDGRVSADQEATLYGLTQGWDKHFGEGNFETVFGVKVNQCYVADDPMRAMSRVIGGVIQASRRAGVPRFKAAAPEAPAAPAKKTRASRSKPQDEEPF